MGIGMSSNSTLIPKRAETLPEQVEVHHEVITLHAGKFTDHANWLTSMHQRVSALERREPGKGSNSTIMWVFGAVWTIIAIVVVLVLLR
jgi:hypothetical protein